MGTIHLARKLYVFSVNRLIFMLAFATGNCLAGGECFIPCDSNVSGNDRNGQGGLRLSIILSQLSLLESLGSIIVALLLIPQFRADSSEKAELIVRVDHIFPLIPR